METPKFDTGGSGNEGEKELTTEQKAEIERIQGEIDRLNEAMKIDQIEMDEIKIVRERIKNMYDTINNDYRDNDLKKTILKTKIKIINNDSKEYNIEYLESLEEIFKENQRKRLNIDKIRPIKAKIASGVPYDNKKILEETLGVEIETMSSLIAEGQKARKDLEKWRKNKEYLLKQDKIN